MSAELRKDGENPSDANESTEQSNSAVLEMVIEPDILDLSSGNSNAC